MKRSIYIFLIFFASQMLAALLAFGVENFQALASGAPLTIDAVAFSPVSIGVGTGIAELLLIAALIWLRLTSTRPFSCLRQGIGGKEWLALLGFLLLSLGISFLMQPFDLADFGMQAQFEAMKSSIFCILTLVVVAPAAEEMVFREGLLREMRAGGAAPWIAIITSALAFAAVHGNPAQMVPAALMGVALGWMYYKTGNVRLCLPAHILNNLMALAEMQFPEVAEAVEAQSAVFCVVCGALLCLAGVPLIVKFVTQNTSK